MNRLTCLGFFFLTILLIGFTGCSEDDPDPTTPSSSNLIANITSTAPSIDGTIDGVWSNATAFNSKVGEDAAYSSAFGSFDVTMKALHDEDNIYFLVSWEDPSGTESVNKNMWSYNETESNWAQSGNEDRFFFLFDTGNNGTEGAKCATMCHSGVMATTGGGNVDVWHWKAARTNPIGLADDKWWDGGAPPDDPDGRGSDAKTIGAYSNNKDGTGTMPKYSGPLSSDGKFIIISKGGSEADLTLFDPTTATGTFPGYILNENADGSRSDVKAKGVYNNGSWTLEIQRKLNTGNDDDVVFTVGSEIMMTIAVTDNSGGSHSGSKVITLEIK